MSDDRARSPNSAPPSPSHQRRRSITFADFMPKPATQRGSTASQSTFFPNAAANPQSNPQRRLSITTLGLSGSPTQPSPFGSLAFRRASLSSSAGSNTGIGNGNSEEAVVEEHESTSPPAVPASPFARRVSFGAQALRDARGGSMSNGEGFHWTEALRSRAERAPSIGAGSPIAPHAHQSAGAGQGYQHQRSASIASTDPPPRDIPKRAKQKPDFFQEKILRGDFMD